MKTAYCTTDTLQQPARVFRLIPAGIFRASDGRPQNLPGWTMNAAAAKQMIAAVEQRPGDVLIDFEHQSLNTSTNGMPAPAAGWFKQLEWREGDGLYVTDARWTENAAKMIAAREYRHISPVFAFDKTGVVCGIVSAALTNTPALEGLTDFAAASRLGIAQPNHYEAGLTAEDRAKLKQTFGEDCFHIAAAREASDLQNAIPPNGISEHDHAKLQASFGAGYALNMQAQS